MISFVLSFISLQLIPQISFTYPPEKWPAFARPLFSVSKVIAEYGDYIFYGLLGIGMGIAYALPKWSNRLRERLDQYAPLALYRDFESGRFLLSLSAAMGGSSSLMQSLQEIQEVATPWLSAYIQQIRLRLSKMDVARHRKTSSINPISFMEVGLFNDFVLDRLHMLAGRVGIEKAIKVVGTDLIDEITEQFVRRSEAVNKWLMGITGLIVLWLIFSMLSVVQEGMSQVVKNIK
jgi:type II secretory pathway component PulF